MVYWTSMDGPEVEHRAEIRRASRAAPMWIALTVAAVLAVVVLGGDGDRDDAEEVRPTTTSSVPSTPTSETLTTTTPPAPVVFGVTDSSRGLAAFSTSTRPAPGTGGDEAAAARLTGPVVTDGLVGVLAGGTLLAGPAGEPLREVGCCYDELHPSNEPGHVWVRAGSDATLVVLAGGRTITALTVGDDRILGPGSFGLVTAGADGSVRWHRPMFAPHDVPVGADRQPLDSGGGLVLTAVEDDVRVRQWELRLLTDGQVVAALDARGTWPRGTSGVLSPDGRVLAVPVPTGWAVRSVPALAEVGRLTRAAPPVWIGLDRFAALDDGRVLLSDGSEVPVPEEVLAVAEQAP